MKYRGSVYLALFVFAFGLVITARAATIQMQFSFADFSFSNGTQPPTIDTPTDPVTGSFRWEAADEHSLVDKFDSVDLTIAGHTYAVNEIGYWAITNSTWGAIGGLTSGSAATTLTDDFILEWDTANLTPQAFVYSSTLAPGFWNSYNCTSFSITNLSVPEPSTFSLAMFGLLAFAGWRFIPRRKHSR